MSVNDKQTGIVLGSNQNSINNNFGELVPATITGSVYINPDNNGTQGAGEPNPSAVNPLPTGTTVTITSTTDPLITFTVPLNPDGTYSQVLPSGTYTVTVNPPTGYSVSTSTELGAGAGANPTTITVLPGETKSAGKDGLYLPKPIAVDDIYNTQLNTPVVINPLGGDSTGTTITSINGVALTAGVTQIIIVPNGTLTIDATGKITFTPTNGFTGTTAFPYVITDAYGQTTTAKQIIRIPSTGSVLTITSTIISVSSSSINPTNISSTSSVINIQSGIQNNSSANNVNTDSANKNFTIHKAIQKIVNTILPKAANNTLGLANTTGMNLPRTGGETTNNAILSILSIVMILMGLVLATTTARRKN